MNVPTPFPASPPPSGSTPTIVAAAAGIGGTPLAIVTVMLWEYYTGTTLDAVRAAAIGSVGAGLFGYAWHAVTAILNRHLNL